MHEEDLDVNETYAGAGSGIKRLLREGLGCNDGGTLLRGAHINNYTKAAEPPEVQGPPAEKSLLAAYFSVDRRLCVVFADLGG